MKITNLCAAIAITLTAVLHSSVSQAQDAEAPKEFTPADAVEMQPGPIHYEQSTGDCANGSCNSGTCANGACGGARFGVCGAPGCRGGIGNRPRYDGPGPFFRGQWPAYPPTAWHGNYAHSQWGQPLALVVPPTATQQTKWSWGVANTVTMPIYHQYGRAYPGPAPPQQGAGGQWLQTPRWPSHTDQFGVYYVRGPW